MPPMSDLELVRAERNRYRAERDALRVELDDWTRTAQVLADDLAEATGLESPEMRQSGSGEVLDGEDAQALLVALRVANDNANRLLVERDALREAIIEHRDQKWRDNGFRYDDWDSRLYRKAGVHPLEP